MGLAKQFINGQWVTIETGNQHSHSILSIAATGIPSTNTFLRGDGTWSAPGNVGNVDGGYPQSVYGGVVPVDGGYV